VLWQKPPAQPLSWAACGKSLQQSRTEIHLTFQKSRAIHLRMSLAEILNELPAFTVAERQVLIRRAFELDDIGLSTEAEKLISSRLEAHHRDPASSVSIVTINESIRSRFSK
jgi:hypothetical protein